MHIVSRNTNTMAWEVYPLFENSDFVFYEQSRNGPVVAFRTPVTLTYTHPWERVNMIPERDANPFFHLFEAAWMLAGRDDVGFVADLVSRMREFSDDGVRLHGAYGRRLELNSTYSALRDVACKIQQDPLTRRAYTTLWRISDQHTQSLDLPCNVGMAFRVLAGKLEITVFNRSNDAVWGGVTGANIVHFSLFQEYVAALTNRPMGSMHVVSNNLHGYLNNPQFRKLRELTMETEVDDPYENWKWSRTPEFVVDAEALEHEAALWCREPERDIAYSNTVFLDTLVPMYHAYRMHKNGETEEAMLSLLRGENIARDWKTAGLGWLLRRAGRGR